MRTVMAVLSSLFSYPPRFALVLTNIILGPTCGQ